RRADPSARCCRTHSFRFWGGITVLCAGDIRRTLSERGRDVRIAGVVHCVACRIRNPREQSSVPFAETQIIRYSHVPGCRERQLLHSSWNRRSAVSPAAPLSGKLWVFTPPKTNPSFFLLSTQHT